MIAVIIFNMENSYKVGQKVDLVILRRTKLGYMAKINQTDEGLIYHNEIFKPLAIGQGITGYIRKVREDGAIDLMLEQIGNLGADDIGARILQALEQGEGYIPVNSKSPSEEIYNLFGISRNKFKIALGRLYKKRLITFTDKGTEIITSEGT